MPVPSHSMRPFCILLEWHIYVFPQPSLRWFGRDIAGSCKLKVGVFDVRPSIPYVRWYTSYHIWIPARKLPQQWTIAISTSGLYICSPKLSRYWLVECSESSDAAITNTTRTAAGVATNTNWQNTCFVFFFVSLLVFCAKSRTCADRNTPHGLFNFCHDGWQHVRNTCFFCCLNIPIVWILQSSWFNAFFFGGWRCDGCEKRFEPGTMLWRCEICVVDFCASDFRFRKFQKQVILESILEPPDHMQ